MDQSGGTVTVGSKRPQGAGGAPPSNPPADDPESNDSSKGVLQGKKEKKQTIKEETVGSRLRVRSLSGSNGTPPLSMKGSLCSADLVCSPMT